MARLRGIVAVLGFPVLLCVGLLGALRSMQAGTPPSLAVGPWIALAYVALALGERLFPLHRSWLRRHDDLATDVGLFLTNSTMNVVATPFVLAAGAHLAARLSEAVGSGLWPSGLPLLIQLPLALVLAELVEYSVHRAMHEVPWLWRLHATHHSARRLYWFNSARFHPVDLFLVGVVKLVPVAVLGAGEAVIALLTLFSAIHGAYQHANLPVRLGPLNWIFSMSELHRWHHAADPAEANHNYGGNLIVWDVVFGTRYLPADREPPEQIGIAAMPRFPTGFWANLAAPFRWRRVLAQSAPPTPQAGSGPASGEASSSAA